MLRSGLQREALETQRLTIIPRQSTITNRCNFKRYSRRQIRNCSALQAAARITWLEPKMSMALLSLPRQTSPHSCVQFSPSRRRSRAQVTLSPILSTTNKRQGFRSIRHQAGKPNFHLLPLRRAQPLTRAVTPMAELAPRLQTRERRRHLIST